MSFEFKVATREKTPTTILIAGQSGTGKTFSALLLARGLVGSDGIIAVSDTEGKRAKIYADNEQIGGFIHVDFRPPHTSERATQVIQAAIKAGAGAIILDCASHEYERMLEWAEELKEAFYKKHSRDGGISIWNKPKVAHKRFLRSAVSAPIHIIFCVRVTTSMDPGTKTITEKFVCDKNDMFEMQISFKLDHNHRAQIIKLPEPFRGLIKDNQPITIEMGKLIAGETLKGVEPETRPELEDVSESAANLGMDAYEKYYSGLNGDDRQYLKDTGLHETNKTAALQANPDSQDA